MQTVPGNLFTRPDTLFGVCEGLGHDFGFNPLFLRVGLAASILWSPLFAVGAYFGLGLVVLLSRLICPDVRLTQVAEAIEHAEPVAEAADETVPVMAEAA